MNLKQLITNIEEEVNAEWRGKRIESMSELHSSIGTIAYKYLPKELVFSLWNIRPKDLYIGFLKYEVDMKDDKRFKNERKGRFISFKIVPDFDYDSETTVDRAIKEVRLRETIENVERLSKHILDIKKELADREKDLSELLVEKHELEKELGK